MLGEIYLRKISCIIHDNGKYDKCRCKGTSSNLNTLLELYVKLISLRAEEDQYIQMGVFRFFAYRNCFPQNPIKKHTLFRHRLEMRRF